MDVAGRLIELSRTLSSQVDALRFSAPVAAVYNPLEYARRGWEAYVRKAATGPRRIVFLGMNPGPWGMAQTGVPFGEVAAVRDWMGVSAQIDRPESEHPKRPIEGFLCTRSEVSGRRLWGLMRDKFGDSASFFAGHFVANYCPLVFMAQSGRNITPDKLRAAEREDLFGFCDEHLAGVLDALGPEYVVGVGKFAEDRIRAVVDAAKPTAPLRIIRVLHPSPASPAANRGWAPAAAAQLEGAGVW